MANWSMRLALVAAGLTVALPSAAQAQQVNDLGKSFTLTKSGLDAGVDANINAAVNRYGRRVGFQEVFNHAEQVTRGLDGAPVPGTLTGFRWGANNESEPDWRPQGITGSADAYDSGTAGPYKVLITSWHGEPTEYSRVTFHNTTTSNANAPYRHALLVVANPDGTATPLQTHAGGLAWIGNHLYVASTDRLLVFRISDLTKVKPALRGEVRTYDYILPLAGAYTANDNPALRFSAVSLDRSQKQKALVTSEFKPNEAFGGRIVRFPVNDDGSTGPTVTSLNAWKTAGIKNIQGALMRGGRFAITTSLGSAPSQLFAGARNSPLKVTTWSKTGVEDLFLVGSNDRLYTLTEFEGSRRVFAVDGSDHGL